MSGYDCEGATTCSACVTYPWIETPLAFCHGVWVTLRELLVSWRSSEGNFYICIDVNSQAISHTPHTPHTPHTHTHTHTHSLITHLSCAWLFDPTPSDDPMATAQAVLVGSCTSASIASTRGPLARWSSSPRLRTNVRQS